MPELSDVLLTLILLVLIAQYVQHSFVGDRLYRKLDDWRLRRARKHD